MWEASESEENSWLVDSSTEQEIEKLLKQRHGKQKKADQNCEGTVPRIP